MSVIAAASSVSSASVRCDLCCQLMPSTAALAAHATSCFEQISQAFNNQLTMAKGDWTAHTQAVLAVYKLTASSGSPAVPSPPSPSLLRKADPLEEQQLLAQHARYLLQMLGAVSGSPAPVTGSDIMSAQLRELKMAQAATLRQFSQQLLSQVSNATQTDPSNATATRLLLGAGIHFCSVILERPSPPVAPSGVDWQLTMLVPLGLPELAIRFIDAIVQHNGASVHSSWKRSSCQKPRWLAKPAFAANQMSSAYQLLLNCAFCSSLFVQTRS